VNEEAVAACLRDGESLFIVDIQHRLRSKRISIGWYEHDLLSEMRGKSIHLWGMNDTQPGHQISRGGSIEPEKATIGLIKVQSGVK
jgi:hypothetical protein